MCNTNTDDRQLRILLQTMQELLQQPGQEIQQEIYFLEDETRYLAERHGIGGAVGFRLVLANRFGKG